MSLKKFNAPCKFKSSECPISFWLASLKQNQHPLYFQQWYYLNFRGGVIDEKIFTGISQIQSIAYQNDMDFHYLFDIAMEAALKSNESENKAEKEKSVSFDYLFKDILPGSDEPEFFKEMFKLYQYEEQNSSGSRKDSINFILGSYVEKYIDEKSSQNYYEKPGSDSRTKLKLKKDDNVHEKLKRYIDSAIRCESDAIYNIVVQLDTSNEFNEAIEEFRKKCEKHCDKDDSEALMALGILELIFDQNNTDKAISYFQRASKYNVKDGSYYLGLIYERGFGSVEPDIKKAIYYYQIGARLNHLYSLFKLAIIYCYGESFYGYDPNRFLSGKEKIEKSDKQAIFYFEKLITFDVSYAYAELSNYYRDGNHVPFDLQKAKLYAEKAIFSNNYNAEVNCLADSTLTSLYTFLGDYYWFFENKNEKCMIYYYYSYKAGARIDELAVNLCPYLITVALKTDNKTKRNECLQNIIKLCEYTCSKTEYGYLYYMLGKIYANFLDEQAINIEKAKEYLTKSMQYYNKRINDDKQSSDSPAYYRLGKILELNILSNINGTKDFVYYYKKAKDCQPIGFFSRIYINKAIKRLNHLESSDNKLTLPNQFENLNLGKTKKPNHDQHVMISYAKETRSIAKLIHEALEKHNFTVWIDYKDMNDHIFNDMAKAVENSSHIIACISEHYEKSQYCQKELSYAISSAKKPIIPIIVTKYSPKGWVGLAIAGIKYYRITDDVSLQENLTAILQTLNR